LITQLIYNYGKYTWAIVSKTYIMREILGQDAVLQFRVLYTSINFMFILWLQS